MILEILSILQKAVSEIIFNSISTVISTARYFMSAVQVFKAEKSTANPIEVLMMILLLFIAGYILYKFLWGSAKSVVIFILVLVFLFFLMAMIL